MITAAMMPRQSRFRLHRAQVPSCLLEVPGLVEPPPHTLQTQHGLTRVDLDIDDGHIHAVHLTDDDIEAFATSGVVVAHCPRSNLKLADGIARIADLLAAGITVGLGTDGAASNNDLDMWEEMRLAAFLQKIDKMNPQVLSASTVLAMATSGGAEAVGLGDKIGSLAAGKRADIIQVSLDDVHFVPTFDLVSHLVYVTDEQDVAAVVVDGRLLMMNGEFLTIDTERVAREAGELASRIQVALALRNAAAN